MKFENAASTNWVANANGGLDFVLTFANSEDAASFTFPGATKARILAVGGGGGGGGAYKGGFSGNYGGGGGGGAGAFVEFPSALYSAGTYAVSVGAGGAGGTKGNTASVNCTGKDGGDTTIMTNDFPMITASGGGGGGSQSAGNQGGSGGGGSMKNSGAVQNAGGQPIDPAQGFAGGAGDKGMYGGGGGGAGGKGGDASSLNPTGGVGRVSDITGAEVWYAGGGGGSHSDKSLTTPTARIAGGKGGGGDGGVGKGSGTAAMGPTAGTDGLGGGGGGCDANTTGTGGKGGSGIVIVRITAASSGPLVKPTDSQHTADGTTAYEAIPDNPFYTRSGDYAPTTTAGIFRATAKLEEGVSWTDGTTNDVTVTMVVYGKDSKSDTVDVTGAPVSFGGAVTNYWVDNETTGRKDLVLGFSIASPGTFILPGTTVARILAVGGGGGGGGAYKGGFSGNYGGGGGGGAGGFVETNDVQLGAETYVVSVGAGGAGGTKGNTAGVNCTGKDGGDTTIVTNGFPMLTAYGGGGGGSQGAGNQGGSGGGGSMKNSGAVVGAGGLPINILYGSAGGQGDVGMYGGGGGGAGGKGGDASSLNPTGGVGRVSDITGAEVWYAGGGGGSHSDKTITAPTARIAGGKGGGGDGGVGKGSGTAAMGPTAGTDGLGGGGGGCDANTTGTGGKGGSGIVYIRISSAMVGPFRKPVDPAPVEYDRNAHTSIVDTSFYRITDGQNIGTNAGTYTATVTLEPGISWPPEDGGGTDPAEVTMVIKPCEATIDDLHLELDGVRTNAWEFGTAAEKTPEPKCEASPEWMEVKYEWRAISTSGEDAASPDAASPWKKWSEGKPEAVGKYWLRATAPDEVNYICATNTFAFEVTKIKVVFSDLYLRSWMYGTPEPPDPSCKVTPEVECVYEWRVISTSGEDAASPGAASPGEWKKWSEGKPTEIGEYQIRVGAPTDGNYDFEYVVRDFSIFGGLGDIFTDYIEVTVGRHALPELTNFPYVIELCETNPVGFAYDRVDRNGRHMAFTDSTGKTVLPYEVGTWETNGVSTVIVRIPVLTDAEQTIRLYWHEREGQMAPDYEPDKVWEDWKREDWESKWPEVVKPANPYPSPVVREGKMVNKWVRLPLMSSTFWDVNDPEEKHGAITQAAVLAYGNPPVSNIVNIVTGETYDRIPTGIGGSFRVSYFLNDPHGDYEPLPPATVGFSIIAHTPWDDLKGDAKTLTLSGRVLLANDDWLGADTPDDDPRAVVGQAYWRTREVDIGGGAILTNDIYWVHGGEEHGDYDSDVKHMLPGSAHWLKYRDGDQEKTLWRLGDVIIGNVFPENGRLFTAQCGLPWSPTQRGNTSYDDRTKVGDQFETGNLILRNKRSAVVYSPCYTNGIGTIYFDAVNGFNSQGTDPFHIVVEVATATNENKEPTDENAAVDGAATIEEEMGKITDWKPVTVLPLFRNGEGAGFTSLAKTNDVVLYATVSRSTNHFYRICAQVNERRPCRFRIRRTAVIERVGDTADNAGLILVDNIVVSAPGVKGDMVSCGLWEKKGSVQETLGWENAMSVPFPSVNDTAVYGRGKPDVAVEGRTDVDPRGVIVRSILHYRWRYLDQASNDWKSVTLNPGDGYVSREPLDFRRQLDSRFHEGDIEYWFENDVNAPYYRLYDYTGLGLGSGSYSEEVSVVTNGYDNPYFLRLREGRSDVESFRLFFKTAADAEPQEVTMNLSGDGTWRGFCPTPSALADGLQVRFEARNRQVPGSASFASNVTYYALSANVEKLEKPVTFRRTATPDVWARVVCDGGTGYLLFQLSESAGSVTIVHADYQNFNLWNDANKTNAVGQRLFVGTSTATSGVSVAARQIDETFGLWYPSTATNDLWQEYFNVTEDDMKEGGDYEVFQPFSEAESPNGLTVGPGQWITANYRDTATGMALQMEGRGKGFIQFVDAAVSPRGLESISFRPRLAQAIEFGDFSYFADASITALTNYTFFCRGTYDINQRRDFSGNASLSLVAFYNAGAGGYEFRIEQENAVIQSGTVTGAGNKQRLSLYRWNYDDEYGDVMPTLLGSEVYDADASRTPNMLKTNGETGNYALLFISAENTGTQTKICAGVSTDVESITKVSGTTSCRWVSYIDDDSGYRLKNGFYGVLSANCPARFRNLNQGHKALTPTTTAAHTFNAATKNFPYPGATAYTSCRSSLRDNGWIVRQSRQMTNTLEHAYNFGLKAVSVTNQTVNVLVGPPGSTKASAYTSLTNVTISTWGTVDPITIPLWSLDECSVRVAAGGTARGARNDIVIDDLVIRQWRGENYDEGENLKLFDETAGDGSPTNFVFTQAWICRDEETGAKGVELNARRSKVDWTRETGATSIRTPLFDGGENRDRTKRGLGLGMFAFSYTNATENARLLLQVCTNGVDTSSLATRTKSVSKLHWQTVATYDFAAMSEEERRSGTLTHYLGWHGVKGVMRLAVDPDLVREVANEDDPAHFGSVTITSAACRDEPNLDGGSWWGWNLQTTDDPSRMYLGDVARGGGSPAPGMAFGLNNSVVEDLYEEPELYLAHVPFLQSPTFASETVGEVSFKARKYDLGDADCRITLYGARKGQILEDAKWVPLRYWTVTNDLFETYTHKTQPGDRYCAFRFAVTGVPGAQPMPPIDPETDPVKRVLIDEVTIMESIRGMVAFRNVAAFRNRLEDSSYVSDAMTQAEQPLCKESWGVQAEVYAASLPEEIDLSHAKVRLWWYEGSDLWGFDNWRKKGKSAWLAECDDTNLVFRSSYLTAREAVMPPQDKATVVQYMLEVVYRTDNGLEATNWLSSADWVKPPWYDPIDLNADYGNNESFSAYTILDTVAPGWAWINEVNAFGEYDTRDWSNTDKLQQFIEIAAPYDADLTGWTVRALDAQFNSSRIVTNDLARFGINGLSGTKKGNKGMDPVSKCVFHVIASPLAEGSFDADDGRIDGTWRVTDTRAKEQLKANGEMSGYYPVSIQLVRPSGIVEHEITCIGTNMYGAEDATCDPERHIAYLNAHELGGDFIDVGSDNQGTAPGSFWSRTLGVFADNGCSPLQWTAQHTATPGRINTAQVISPDYPKPRGSMVSIFSMLSDTDLRQSFGDVVNSNQMSAIFFQKGAERGTNITYHVDNWFVLGDVTETIDGKTRPVTSWTRKDRNTYVLEVGANISNDLTVTAGAAVDPALADRYGIRPDDPYRRAIVKWLAEGRTLGGAFHDPDATELGLADLVNASEEVITNLSLKAMYWLDIDPTYADGDIRYHAYYSKPPLPTARDGGRLTNVVAKVLMKITNSVEGTCWAPYVLRSAEPGVTSWDYADVAAQWNWSNVTFKVTGILSTDGTIPGAGDLRDRRLPLRWFVFAGGLAGGVPYSTSFDANFESEIEVIDPYSKESPGYGAGWYDWVHEHGWCPVFWSFDIDDRRRMSAIEVLRTSNLYHYE